MVRGLAISEDSEWSKGATSTLETHRWWSTTTDGEGEVLLLVADGAARWWHAVPGDVVSIANEVEKGEVAPSAHTRRDGALHHGRALLPGEEQQLDADAVLLAPVR
jgi:hypothetical protein